MDNGNANKKIIPYKKKKQLNVWILVSVLVFIYLIVYFCTYTFNGQVSVCEVSEGITTGRFDSQYSTLVLREESVVNCADSGYINYFAGDGSSIYKGEEIYLLDKSGEIYNQLTESINEETVLDKTSLEKLDDSIYDFDVTFDEQNYYDAYNIKYKLESQILDSVNSSTFSEIISGLDGSKNYQISTCEIPGIIAHYTDGYENLDLDNIESSYFKKSEYEKNVIRSNDYVEKDTPVYKVVTDDSWKLVFQIKDTSAFEDLDSVDIEFLKDNIKTTGSFEMITKSGNAYGVISLSKYMVRYLSDRYLQIKITDDTKEGLKIPKSSVSVHQYYKIPIDYLTKGGNSNSYGFNLQTSDGKDSSVEFITPEIDSKTDEYVYVDVDSEDLKDGDVLVMNDSTETFTVKKKENRDCAYVIESGYASLKTVDILGENGNYYIVDNSSSGIHLYDQVVKDYEQVSKGQQIY